MNKSTQITRIVLGSLLLIIVLNTLLNFLPQPALSPEMGQFFGALTATGYMLPFILIIEAICSFLLFTNKYTPLALVMLTPIIINALAAHLVLNGGGGIGAAVVVALLMGYLIYAYRQRFYPLLKPQPIFNNDQS